MIPRLIFLISKVTMHCSPVPYKKNSRIVDKRYPKDRDKDRDSQLWLKVLISNYNFSWFLSLFCFKNHLNRQHHKSWFMKPKFSFFMITHFTDCAAWGISHGRKTHPINSFHIPAIPGASSSQASPTFPQSALQWLLPFQLQKSLLQSPLMANTSRLTSSRNTRNANLPASSSAGVRTVILI